MLREYAKRNYLKDHRYLIQSHHDPLIMRSTHVLNTTKNCLGGIMVSQFRYPQQKNIHDVINKAYARSPHVHILMKNIICVCFI